MQATKRLGASGVYVAPVGTRATDGGWKQVGYIDAALNPGWLTPIIDRDMLAIQDRINRAARDYSIPWRYTTGLGSDGSFEVTLPRLNVSDAARNLYLGGNALQRSWLLGIDPASNISSPNERSKPVGLTREYRYTDNDGDFVEIDPANRIADPHDVVAVIETGSKGTAAYIKNADSVPLALNVLGHDRPELARDTARTATAVVRGDGHRDELLAQAAANLRAIDLYDQHVAKKRADEEAAAEVAKAEAEVAAKWAAHEARLARVNEARDQLRNAATALGRTGGYPGNALSVLKAATENYEAAQYALRSGVDI